MTTKKETVTSIALEKLVPFRDHPFQVRDDDQMQMITESIRSVGVLVPAIARPLENGTYELIAGHRRKHACELAGLSKAVRGPVSHSDDEAAMKRQAKGRYKS